MRAKGKDTERMFSSLVKELKIQSHSIGINTKTSLCLPECRIWPRIPACWRVLVQPVMSGAHMHK